MLHAGYTDFIKKGAHPRVLVVNGQLGNALHGPVGPALNVGLAACTLEAGFPHPQLLGSLCYGVLSKHCQHYGQPQHLHTALAEQGQFLAQALQQDDATKRREGSRVTGC